ncbi:hypothetical protein [Streptomyces sp. CMB-StM0423]|uniref:hypothetical protein n=1 Tax=Streptomyces sp. CMB-StM0423 TaxID=2059884 RepID=UPI001F2E5549|nr:hypothetical protein [Streptomyces sp. CMB-StM0423]
MPDFFFGDRVKAAFQVRQEFGTAVADGTYCNVLDGCATKVTVAAGRVALDLPAKGAVAFHP